MSGHIAAMKNYITLVARSVNEFYPDVPLRLAFVGYRDHCDGDDRLAVFRFSPDISAFQSFVGSQGAKGGGDGPEDVFGALSVASSFEWQAATRLIYHIADAPCHGTKYHSSNMGDGNPNGDPHGLQAEDLIRDLILKKIQYNFGEMNSSTTQMIRIFNEIAAKNNSPNYITTFNAANSATMMTSVATSVTASMYTSISSSKSIGKDEDEELPVVLDRSEPNWSTIPTETVAIYSLNLTSTAKSQLSIEEPRYLVSIPENTSLKVAKHPFSHGSIRAVYKVNCSSNVVHKIPRKSRTSDKVREKFEASYISPHWAAMILAINFEAVRPSGYPSIQYTNASLVQYLERPGAPYCTQETLMEGAFEKYNNNSGMVLPNPSPSGANHDVIQAFSHWTHHIMGGSLVVVDCQGVFNHATNAFLLTDPAIHCMDPVRYGNTNLHKVGIRRFFLSHRCNGCCRELGLRMPDAFVE
jgi:hypothetical protein